MNLSLTQTSNYVALTSLLVPILAHYGVVVAESELSTILVNIVTVGAVLSSIYGRYRQGDISVLGVKESDTSATG